MDIRNYILEGTIDNTPIMQLNTLNSSSIEEYTRAVISELADEIEDIEGSFCLLPPYCLIEDKYKYIAD